MNASPNRPLRTLTVVMPAFDEEAGIAEALATALDSLEGLLRDDWLDDVQLIVVDDGSGDGTADIVGKIADIDPRVVLLRHERNRGVGAALRTGVAAASGELLLYTDADMPVDLGEIARGLPLLATSGVVLGRRFRYGADGRFRAATSYAYDILVRVALGVSVTDVNFPFKLLRTEDARGLMLCSDGPLVDAELLARSQSAGMDFATIDLEYRARTLGHSKTMTVRQLWRLARELGRYSLSIRRS